MSGFLDKAKKFGKQATDQGARLVKIGKLKTNILTLNSEKDRHLKTIGLRAYTLFGENRKIDGVVLQEKIRDEITQIERIEGKIREHEAEISELQQAAGPHVDVTDVTEEDDDDDEDEKETKAGKDSKDAKAKDTKESKDS